MTNKSPYSNCAGTVDKYASQHACPLMARELCHRFSSVDIMVGWYPPPDRPGLRDEEATRNSASLKDTEVLCRPVSLSEGAVT